jgi:hypothetical protein
MLELIAADFGAIGNAKIAGPGNPAARRLTTSEVIFRLF